MKSLSVTCLLVVQLRKFSPSPLHLEAVRCPPQGRGFARTSHVQNLTSLIDAKLERQCHSNAITRKPNMSNSILPTENHCWHMVSPPQTPEVEVAGLAVLRPAAQVSLAFMSGLRALGMAMVLLSKPRMSQAHEQFIAVQMNSAVLADVSAIRFEQAPVDCLRHCPQLCSPAPTR